MELTPGRKWGIMGIVLLVVYYVASVIITTFISKTTTTTVFILAMAVFFAFLTLYTGIMAFRNGSKVFGIINILLALVIIILTLSSLFGAVSKAIETLPTF